MEHGGATAEKVMEWTNAPVCYCCFTGGADAECMACRRAHLEYIQRHLRRVRRPADKAVSAIFPVRTRDPIERPISRRPHVSHGVKHAHGLRRARMFRACPRACFPMGLNLTRAQRPKAGALVSHEPPPLDVAAPPTEFNAIAV